MDFQFIYQCCNYLIKLQTCDYSRYSIDLLMSNIIWPKTRVRAVQICSELFGMVRNCSELFGFVLIWSDLFSRCSDFLFGFRTRFLFRIVPNCSELFWIVRRLPIFSIFCSDSFRIVPNCSDLFVICRWTRFVQICSDLNKSEQFRTIQNNSEQFRTILNAILAEFVRICFAHPNKTKNWFFNPTFFRDKFGLNTTEQNWTRSVLFRIVQNRSESFRIVRNCSDLFG